MHTLARLAGESVSLCDHVIASRAISCRVSLSVNEAPSLCYGVTRLTVVQHDTLSSLQLSHTYPPFSTCYPELWQESS